MKCPRDGTDLIVEHVHQIEVDHCPVCNGRWLDHHELDQLEATRADGDDLSGTIDYSKRESELACPVCEKPMYAFNYRAYDLELDTCSEEHGFWLDAGEDGRIRDVIDERVRGLKRARSAEESWSDFLEGLRGDGGDGGGAWNSVRSFFRGRR